MILENIAIYRATVILTVGTSLPQYVVDKNSANIFKSHLDKHWHYQDELYHSVTGLILTQPEMVTGTFVPRTFLPRNESLGKVRSQEPSFPGIRSNE